MLIAITPKCEDKYVVKVFNSSEFHLSEMTFGEGRGEGTGWVFGIFGRTFDWWTPTVTYYCYITFTLR